MGKAKKELDELLLKKYDKDFEEKVEIALNDLSNKYVQRFIKLFYPNSKFTIRLGPRGEGRIHALKEFAQQSNIEINNR